MALLTFTATTVYVARAILLHTKEAPLLEIHSVSPDELAAVKAQFEAEIQMLTMAVDTGIAGYQRAEKRVQKTVAGARRLLREAGIEHAPLEAEAAQLQSRDDEGSGEGKLPAVPESVAPPRTIRIPGGKLTIGVA